MSTQSPTRLSTRESILRHLQCNEGRVVRYNDLVRETDCDGNPLKWALFCLIATGTIAAIGSPGIEGSLRYRLSSARHVMPIAEDLRQVRAERSQGSTDPGPVRLAVARPKSVSQGDVKPSKLLETWLLAQCGSRNTDIVGIRDVQRCGPSVLRDKTSLAAALSELAALGRVTLVEDGLKRLVKVNPELLKAAVAGVATLRIGDDPKRLQDESIL
jgi:hypothetical protein